MNDSKGIAFAIALLLLWIAGVCFFVAFHPGGVQLNGQDAKNPVDVLKWLLTMGAEGASKGSSSSSSTGTGSSGTGASGTQVV